MNNKKINKLNVNNNDQYFGNSIPSSPIKNKSIASKLLSKLNIADSSDDESNNGSQTYSSSNNLSINNYNSNNDNNDDSDDNISSSNNSEYYKYSLDGDFFNSVLQEIKEQKRLEEDAMVNQILNNDEDNEDMENSSNNSSNNNSIGTYESFKDILNIKDSSDTLQNNDNNNNNNNNNDIVLVNSKNLLTPTKNNNNNNKSSDKIKRKRKKRSNIIYTNNQFHHFLERIKKDTDLCGNEFSKLLLNINAISDTITKISLTNMENYSNTIDKTTLEAFKSAESMKLLVNALELLNSDIFEIYKLNNQVKSVKKDIDQLESLVLKLINNK